MKRIRFPGRERSPSRFGWAAAGVMLLAITACAPVSAAPIPGHPAPAFNLPLLGASRSVSLQDLLAQHKPIIVNAWASWCGPCKMETPDLVQHAHAYTGRVLVVGVNMTAQDSVTDAQAFVQKYHIDYAVLMDPQGKFLDAYHIQGFPTTFLLAPNGSVVKVVVGTMSKTTMAQLFTKAAQLATEAGSAP
ncbi:MAG: TlpA family protein disulfide reductase [Alicyclobacillus sp.]|nr:TlpA family protein disulfide reductase [Alicyclobacillus sp.]